MRRQFRLPELDEEFLDSQGLPWETVVENGVQWLVIHDWPLPAGYNHATAFAAVVIPPAYPDVQIDMVYFFPALARVAGGNIGGLTARAFDAKSWQQWSRHRTGQNPWRPGEDDVAGHLIQVRHWLAREIQGGVVCLQQ
jgi:hypothetical protein